MGCPIIKKKLEYDILYNLEIILNTFENLLTYGLHTFVHGHCVQQADGSDQSSKEGKTMEATIEKVEVIYPKQYAAHPSVPQVFVLRVPLGPVRFWSSQSTFPERNSLLVGNPFK